MTTTFSPSRDSLCVLRAPDFKVTFDYPAVVTLLPDDPLTIVPMSFDANRQFDFFIQLLSSKEFHVAVVGDAVPIDMAPPLRVPDPLPLPSRATSQPHKRRIRGAERPLSSAPSSELREETKASKPEGKITDPPKVVVSKATLTEMGVGKGPTVVAGATLAAVGATAAPVEETVAVADIDLGDPKDVARGGTDVDLDTVLFSYRSAKRGLKMFGPDGKFVDATFEPELPHDAVLLRPKQFYPLPPASGWDGLIFGDSSIRTVVVQGEMASTRRQPVNISRMISTSSMLFSYCLSSRSYGYSAF